MFKPNAKLNGKLSQLLTAIAILDNRNVRLVLQ